jgi:hypothetical protein
VSNQTWVPRINVDSLVKVDPISVPGEVNFKVRLNVCTCWRDFICVYGSPQISWMENSRFPNQIMNYYNRKDGSLIPMKKSNYITILNPCVISLGLWHYMPVMITITIFKLPFVKEELYKYVSSWMIGIKYCTFVRKKNLVDRGPLQRMTEVDYKVRHFHPKCSFSPWVVLIIKWLKEVVMLIWGWPMNWMTRVQLLALAKNVLFCIVQAGSRGMQWWSIHVNC